MFECLEVAHEVAQHIGAVLPTILRHDPNLSDQLKRAVTSVVSNLDEGRSFDGRRRRQHYRYAAGSTNEVTSQLRLAIAWRYVDADTLAPTLALLDRVRAMLWRLTR